MAAPLIAELLLGWFSWRGVVAALGITSFIIGMVFLKMGKGGEFYGEAPSITNLKTLLAQPAFWIITVLFALAISSSLGIFTMLPLFLVVEHNMSQTQANTLVGLSRLPGIGLAFVSGWATDRFGPKSTMAVVFFLTALTTMLLGLTSTLLLIALVIIQPMLAVSFFPAGFAALSSLGSAKIRNMAVSLAVPFAFLLGGGAVPLCIGMIGDVWSFGTSFVVIGALIFGGFLLSRYLKI